MKVIATQGNRTALHRQIVEAAVLAPSAENVQPWRFRSDGQRLTLCLDREQGFPSDVGWMLTFTGMGACLENGVIAARESGFEPTITLLDTNSGETDERYVPLATLEFNEPGKADPLFPFLAARCTNRRMNGTPAISRGVLAELAASGEQFSDVRVAWLTDATDITEASQLIGDGNRIRFEHEPFHGELYHNLRFTPAEARATGDGLDVATLQLPPGVAWGDVAAADVAADAGGKRAGVFAKVARQAAQEVRSSAAVGILSVDAASADRFIQGGRALERLWLSATALGLALHPAASLAVFLAHAERTDLGQLLPHHATRVRGMTERFYRLCPAIRGRVVQIMFRLGHSSPPDVRSLRRGVYAVFEPQS